LHLSVAKIASSCLPTPIILTLDAAPAHLYGLRMARAQKWRQRCDVSQTAGCKRLVSRCRLEP